MFVVVCKGNYFDMAVSRNDLYCMMCAGDPFLFINVYFLQYFRMELLHVEKVSC